MTKKITLAIVACIAVAICLLLAFGRRAQRNFFYPEPPLLPSQVNKTTEQLFAELQSTLDKNATNVAKALRPGLSDAEISKLESTYNVTLPNELRTLYKWHNGIAGIEFFPGHHFVTLEDSLKSKHSNATQPQSAAQRAGWALLAAHRNTWIEVFPDGAGDGYFFDLARTNKPGPFFYHMAEDGHYLWFPSLQNFLAALNECYQSGAYSPTNNLETAFAKAEPIWTRFGAANPE